MFKRFPLRKGSKEGKGKPGSSNNNNNDDDDDDDDDESIEESGSMKKPNEVNVRGGDGSSVVSGLSNPEFLDDYASDEPLEIPDVIEEAGESDIEVESTTRRFGTTKSSSDTSSVDLMSPPGKKKKVLKKKATAGGILVRKKSKKFTPPSFPEPDEDNSPEDCEVAPVKPGKKVVVKKTKAEPENTSGPTFQIDVDLEAEEKPMSGRSLGTGGDSEHKSVRSGVTRKIKKMKKLSSSLSDSNDDGASVDKLRRTGSKSCERSRSRSKSRDGPRSRSRSKSKSGSGTVGDGTNEEERSRVVRAGTKKKAVASRGISPRTTDGGSRRSSRSLDVSLDTATTATSSSAVLDKRQAEALKDENDALLEETAILRRQINEMRNEMRKVKSEKNEYESNVALELLEMQKDLNRAQNESTDLRQEIEDYDESIAEKDSLIKKLTEAVDAQLDKVEHLELKLQRAEAEFVKMEEEMKEMEDVIEHLQAEPNDQQGAVVQAESFDARKKRNMQVELEFEEREREIVEKEQFLLEKEDGLREREALALEEQESLKAREIALEEQEQELDEIIEERLGRQQENAPSHGQVNEALERELEAKTDELLLLKRNLAQVNEEKEELEKQLSLKDISESKLASAQAKVDALAAKNERLQKLEDERLENDQDAKEERDKEMDLIQENISNQLKELEMENCGVRQEMEYLRQRQNARVVTQRKDSENPNDDYVQELELEIADLREKIVEQEQHARRQKDEITAVFVTNEEVKQELEEREVELRDLEAQLTEIKVASSKKMTQKDETIAFMQTEMMRIMQEKQKVDRQLREQKLSDTEKDLKMAPHHKGYDEEAEMAKLQAINDQLRQLDDENRRLDEELKETQYKNQLRLKETQSIILDLQEELSDAKWELGARKEGADYISLLKDRKDRKRDLDKTRKELKKAEERISDLEREYSEMLANKKELEKEVEELNKSVVSMDSGEYVVGLKRQIKSLKQHNMALERKNEVETREADEKTRLRDAKIKILEQELEKIQNPAQAAVRGIFAGFGRKSLEEKEMLERAGGKLNGVEDQRTKANATGIPEESRVNSPEKPKQDSALEDLESAGGGIWNIFSPRKSPLKKVQPQRSGSFGLSRWKDDESAGVDKTLLPTTNGAKKDEVEDVLEGADRHDNDVAYPCDNESKTDAEDTVESGKRNDPAEGQAVEDMPFNMDEDESNEEDQEDVPDEEYVFDSDHKEGGVQNSKEKEEIGAIEDDQDKVMEAECSEGHDHILNKVIQPLPNTEVIVGDVVEAIKSSLTNVAGEMPKG